MFLAGFLVPRGMIQLSDGLRPIGEDYSFNVSPSYYALHLGLTAINVSSSRQTMVHAEGSMVIAGHAHGVKGSNLADIIHVSVHRAAGISAPRHNN